MIILYARTTVRHDRSSHAVVARNYPTLACGHAARAQNLKTNLPSDTPQNFNVNTNAFDYFKREEMIPMRDGVKLKTVILVPRGAANAPMLLTRPLNTRFGYALRVMSAVSPMWTVDRLSS